MLIVQKSYLNNVALKVHNKGFLLLVCVYQKRAKGANIWIPGEGIKFIFALV